MTEKTTKVGLNMGYLESPILDSVRTTSATGVAQSDDMRWLTRALATSFALTALAEAGEISADEARPQAHDEAVSLFMQCLHEGGLNTEDKDKVCSLAVDNLIAISGVTKRFCAFEAKRAMGVCTAFTNYWLFTTLLDLEWQQKLSSETVAESFRILDGVIADQEELHEIMEKQRRGDALFDDEIIYLRTHWQNAREFFNRLRSAADLARKGFLEM